MADNEYKYLDKEGLLYFWQKIKAAFVGSVQYDSTNQKITQTKNGATTDIVTLSTMKSAMSLNNVNNTADANKSVASAAKLTSVVNTEGIKFDGSAAVSHYAICSTVNTTAAKVATISPTTTNFELAVGTRVFVNFTNAISVSGATLNVNSTGAKQITYRGVDLETGKVKANSTHEFVYNGTEWELVGDIDTNTVYQPLSQTEANTGTATSDRTITAKVLNDTILAKSIPYAECSTAGATAAKEVSVSNFTLKAGSKVIVKFNNTNTAAVANLTLNVNSTGAKSIRYRDGTLPYPAILYANNIYLFVWDGGDWEIVGDLFNKNDIPDVTSKANIASPEFTGTPTAPTAAAGTNTTQIATTAFVSTAITNAISGITGFSFEIVASLPATGETGVIYLVAHSHGTGDIYDEYIWTGTAFEKIGNTDVDLSGYVQATQMAAITNSEIDTVVAS